MSFTVEIINSYVNIFEKILKFLHVKFRGIRLGPLEFELKKNSTYQETIEKIETTKKHLNEAIDSVDNLHSEILEKKKELDHLIEYVDLKRIEKNQFEKEYQTTKKMRDDEAERLKDILGIYELKESKTSKVSGFFAGVIASIVATVLYTITVKFFLPLI